MTDIIFQDGNQVRRIKGRITSEDNIFITMQSEHKIFKINKQFIIKIEEEAKE